MSPQDSPRSPSRVPPAEVRWWPLLDGVEPPTRATDGSFGHDLKTVETVIIPPKYTVLARTGFALELPSWLGMLILPRSGRATKEGVIVANSPGLIDSDYRGEIMIALYNRSDHKRIYPPGVGIAQAIFTILLQPTFEQGSGGVSQTKRGAGGFGSSDKKGGTS